MAATPFLSPLRRRQYGDLLSVFNKTPQPSAGFYHRFNFANFDLPGAALNGLLTGTAGQIKGTTPTGHDPDRVGVGTGVYSMARRGGWSSG